MDNKKVYFVANELISLDINDTVYLKDLGDIYCQDEKLKEDLGNIKVYTSNNVETWDFVNTTDIFKSVLGKYPNLEIEYLGKEDIILEIKSKEKINPILEFLKISFVTLTLFFGAALGIMYFHEDVNMVNAMEKLYFTFTGEKKENPLIMNIPYSIGLGIGMVVFFSRIFSSSKRRKMEPGPMDVELYSYNKDVNDYVLYELKNKRSKE